VGVKPLGVRVPPPAFCDVSGHPGHVSRDVVDSRSIVEEPKTHKGSTSATAARPPTARGSATWTGRASGIGTSSTRSPRSRPRSASARPRARAPRSAAGPWSHRLSSAPGRSSLFAPTLTGDHPRARAAHRAGRAFDAVARLPRRHHRRARADARLRRRDRGRRRAPCVGDAAGQLSPLLSPQP
jgi:hypothetical protein